MIVILFIFVTLIISAESPLLVGKLNINLYLYLHSANVNLKTTHFPETRKVYESIRIHTNSKKI